MIKWIVLQGKKRKMILKREVEAINRENQEKLNNSQDLLKNNPFLEKVSSDKPKLLLQK